jgi:hypothetical protein
MAFAYTKLSKNLIPEFSIYHSVAKPILDLDFVGIRMMQDLGEDVLKVVSAGDENALHFMFDNIGAIKDVGAIV